MTLSLWDVPSFKSNKQRFSTILSFSVDSENLIGQLQKVITPQLLTEFFAREKASFPTIPLSPNSAFLQLIEVRGALSYCQVEHPRQVPFLPIYLSKT